MRMFIGGMIAGVALLFVGFFLFVSFGGMPAAAKAPPLPFEKFFARKGLRAATQGERDKVSPLPADDANLTEGAKVFIQHCQICHGSPHSDQSLISKGLGPEAPYFFPDDKGVTDDPVGKIFWFVKNGIRLTGMPAFEGGLTDQQMWQVTLFLKNANHLSEPVQKSFKDLSSH